MVKYKTLLDADPAHSLGALVIYQVPTGSASCTFFNGIIPEWDGVIARVLEASHTYKLEILFPTASFIAFSGNRKTIRIDTSKRYWFFLE